MSGLKEVNLKKLTGWARMSILATHVNGSSGETVFFKYVLLPHWIKNTWDERHKPLKAVISVPPSCCRRHPATTTWSHNVVYRWSSFGFAGNNGFPYRWLHSLEDAEDYLTTLDARNASILHKQPRQRVQHWLIQRWHWPKQPIRWHRISETLRRKNFDWATLFCSQSGQ